MSIHEPTTPDPIALAAEVGERDQIEALTGALRRISGATRVGLMGPEGPRGPTRPTLGPHPSVPGAEGGPERIGELARRVVATDRPLTAPRAKAGSRSTGEACAAFAGVPVRLHPSGAACLYLLDHAGRVWSERDVELLREFGSLIEGAARAAAGSRAREDRLEAAESRYRLLVEGSDEVFFYRHDADHRFTYLSPSVEQVLGYTPDELIGRPYDVLLLGDPTAEETHERTEAALASGRQGNAYRTRVSTRDGRAIVLELIETPVEDAGGETALQGFARDVTHLERARAALERRFRTDRALARVSSALTTETDPDLSGLLGRLGSAVEACRAYLFMFRDDGRRVDNTHEWCAPGVEPQIENLQDMESASLPWWVERLRNHETIHIGDVGAMPAEAAAEREILEAQDIRSLIVVPIGGRNGGLSGFIGFDDTKGHHSWTEEDVRALRTAGEMLAAHMQRREADAALRMEEERLRLALHAGRMGTWEFDVEGEVMHLSPEVAALYGLDPAELDGKVEQVMERIHPDDREALFNAAGERLTEGGQYQIVHRVSRPDGATRWIESFGNVIVDEPGTPPRILGLSIDVTDRVEMEEKLRRREAYYRALVENGGDLVGVFHEDGSARYLSPGYARVLGYTMDELQDPDLGRFVHPDDFENAVRVFGQVSAEPGARAELEVRLRTKEGTSVILGAVITNMMDVPEVRGIVVNAQDLTEQRALEAQLIQAQKMEAIGRLAGGIAHDFNNLLTVIEGHGRFLVDEVGGDDARQIVRAAARGASLTRQLLQFSRQQVVKAVDLHVPGELDEIEEMLRRIVGEHIALDVAMDHDTGHVRMDPGHLNQVLMNLVVNARDALGGAGGRLEVRTRCVRLTRTLRGMHDEVPPGEYVEIAVNDDGPGIPTDVLPKIFEPFFTTKGPGHGTGLGLATVYGIVKQQGGGVLVESRPGQGTSFRIFLPRVARRRVTEEPASLKANGGRGERVLLVEDDEALRGLLERMLAKLEYEVRVASNSAEALHIVEEEGPPDLLLSDVVMPGTSGPELAAHLRTTCPGLRVLFVSGYTADEVFRQGLAEGCDPYLEKPFDLDDLGRNVHAALRGDGTEGRRPR